MKPIKEHIQIPIHQTLRIITSEHPYFHTPWHHHPEYELIFIEKSEGVRFVGDSIQNFRKGDLVLMSPDLPHYWKNSASYYSNTDSEIFAKARVIHFYEDAWLTAILQMPEMRSVREWFPLCKSGICFKIRDYHEIEEIFNEMQVCQETGRLIAFLKLLNLLNNLEKEVLASEEYETHYLPARDKRLDRVVKHVMNHYMDRIYLNKVAEIANMTPAGFSRYFKQKTGKPFSRFVNEIRIRYACRLLAEKQKIITEVCYESGFYNMSNFIEQFKSIVGVSPSAYQKSI